jgi:hypothetical protein
MTLTIENKKFILRFKYDPLIIDKLHKINCGTFEKAYQAWSFPLTAVAYKKLKREFGLELPEVEEWLQGRKRSIMVEDHTFKTVPLPHQIEAIKFVLTTFGMEVL